jgi:threonine synthase
VSTIKKTYTEVSPKYILDPHSAVAVTAALRRIEQDGNAHHVALSTAHPAKFADAVNKALAGEATYEFERDVLPDDFKVMLKQKTKKLFADEPDIEVIKRIIVQELEKQKTP